MGDPDPRVKLRALRQKGAQAGHSRVWEHRARLLHRTHFALSHSFRMETGVPTPQGRESDAITTVGPCSQGLAVPNATGTILQLKYSDSQACCIHTLGLTYFTDILTAG